MHRPRARHAEALLTSLRTPSPWKGAPAIPGGLWTKLVISYAGIVMVCLALAGSAFVYLLQPYQTQQALNRLSELAIPLGVQVRILETQGATPSQIAGFLEEQAQQLSVRIFLITQDGQTIVHDTAHDSGGGLAGRPIHLNRTERLGTVPILHGGVEAPGEGTLALVSFVPPTNLALPGVARPAFARPPRLMAALAAPHVNLAAGWLQIAPQLETAALVSLLASIGVALLIARSVARPLTAITRASEGIARGDYDQRIPVRGHDELARLASAFNTMAHQVAQSNRSLRDFLADVSHELRTPLTTVQGFSQAILDGTAANPHAVAEAARVISEDAARMHRMVEDLLHLSQIQSGQLAMDTRVVDLAELAEDAVKRARQRADANSLRFELSAQPPPYVAADPHRIGQVLDNLLSNAINHTPPGGEITVSAGASLGQGHVRVHNPGSFIAPEDRERIFQRFARGRDSGGTGLGLPIAQEIARCHGGRIDLESSPSEGTAFTLVLPRLPRTPERA